MSETQTQSIRSGRAGVMLTGTLLTLLLLTLAVRNLSAAEGEVTSERLEAAQLVADKLVAQPVAAPGGMVDYTVTITNVGTTTAQAVSLVDTLPAGVTYQSGSLVTTVSPNAIEIGFGEAGGVITWTGQLGSNGYVVLGFSAVVDAGVASGTSITNVAEVTGTGTLLRPEAATTVFTEADATDLSGSAKLVDAATAVPGQQLAYTVHISNSGQIAASQVSLSDALPTGLTYVPSSLSATAGTFGAAGNVITWTGSVAAGGMVMLDFAATVDNSVAPDTVLTNTAVITGPAGVTTVAAATLVMAAPPTTTTLYLPILLRPVPGISVLQATRPNSNNDWQVFWSAPGSGFEYELQEAKEPSFASPATFMIQGATNYLVDTHDPSLDNVYYYRVRAKEGSVTGPWSNIITVRGGWLDEFDDDTSGWAMRRTTFLEETVVKYGNGDEAGNLIILVADRWDWMIASPMVAAPEPPYAIEYRMRVHDASNLVSGGLVVGGDWNGDDCPELGMGTIYTFDNCFNEFYNFNYIFYGPMKLLFERVDELFYCPNCGGSPIKRLGDIGNTWPSFDVHSNSSGKDWHTYRVEVRDDGLYLYINGSFKRHFQDDNYVNNPYFGVFASTDEYKPSIWFFDYFEVTYLD